MAPSAPKRATTSAGSSAAKSPNVGRPNRRNTSASSGRPSTPTGKGSEKARALAGRHDIPRPSPSSCLAGGEGPVGHSDPNVASPTERLEHRVDVITNRSRQRFVAPEVSRRTTGGEPGGARPHDLDARREHLEGVNDGFERAGFAGLVTFDHHHIGTAALRLAPALTDLDVVEARRRRGGHHPIGEHHRRRDVGRGTGRHHRPVRALDHERAHRHRLAGPLRCPVPLRSAAR